jgi:transposase
MDDSELERRLFTLAAFEGHPERPLPDWNHVHNELKRRGVTLLLLWEEYRADHADRYGYSRFCDLYRGGRQTRGPAEKLFVDFAGDTMAVLDAATGEERRTQIFVAMLGASNYIFAIACALGHKACRDNRSVLYQRLPRLFDALALGRGDGRHARPPQAPAASNF